MHKKKLEKKWSDVTVAVIVVNMGDMFFSFPFLHKL